MVLQTSGAWLLSQLPGTETSSIFDSEFPSFLKLGGYITAELPAVLLLQHTNYPSCNRGVFATFF